MSDKREQFNSEPVEEYTLEAILAEYKSEAFLKNERRLSREELEKQAEEIIREMRRLAELEVAEEAVPQTELLQEEPATQPEQEAESAAPQESSHPEMVAEELPERELYAKYDPVKTDSEYKFTEDIARAEKAIQKDEARRRRKEEQQLRAERRAALKAQRLEEQSRRKEEEPELTLAEAMSKYAYGLPSLRRRTFISFLICALMVLLLIFDRTGTHVALLFPPDPVKQAMSFMLLQLLVMLFGVDVLINGLTDLFTLKPSGDSLAALACLASLADALLIILGRADNTGQPYCTAAACTLAFALQGSKLKKKGYRIVFKTMKATKVPTIVTAEGDKTEEGVVLCRKLGSSAGFIKKTEESNIADRVYLRLAPLLIIASALFALVAAAMNGGRVYVHFFAAMTAVSASFTVSLIYNRPFAAIARRLADYGAVIAGWTGAKEISEAVGIVIKDNDLFPENTITLNGVKVLSNAPVEKVISYTGSLIIASGSGLSRVFGELLREYASSIYRIEDFSCYDSGGIGAYIKGNNVLVGTAAFMNLMGIRIPQNVDVAGAVYSAIDGELAGVFIINYMPVDMVQNALVSIIQSDVTPIFAVRDFNISPAMLKNKFKVTTDSLTFLPFQDRYRLSSDSDTGTKPSALMSRDGLNHFVELAACGRRLIRAVKSLLALTVTGSILGLLIVFFALARSAYASASAINVVIFMALWAMAVLLFTDSASGK
jgi:hypothetical protein